MAHTNETVNYHLSQFVGTDIPNPLTDYNGDMEKIDTAIKNVADSAVSEGGRITALETQNGSEVLTTTAQTLSGAVNELDNDVTGIDSRLTIAEGKIVADEATLDITSRKVTALETAVGNETLTTTAPDCTGAINELDAKMKSLNYTVVSQAVGDGTKTVAAMLNELYTDLMTHDDVLTTKPVSLIYLVEGASINFYTLESGTKSSGNETWTFSLTRTLTNKFQNIAYVVSSNSSATVYEATTSGGTFVDHSSDVVPAGHMIAIII